MSVHLVDSTNRIHVAGESNTRINGTIRAEFDANDVTSIVVETGAGHDTVEAFDLDVTDLQLYLGDAGPADDDTLSVRDTIVRRDLLADLRGGVNDTDIVSMEGVVAFGPCNVRTGDGSDRVTAEFMSVFGDFTVDADDGLLEGSGSDRVVIQTVSVQGEATISTAGIDFSDDEDTVRITDMIVDQHLTVSMGQADDHLIAFDLDVGGDTLVTAGMGPSIVDIQNSTFGNNLTCLTGGLDDDEDKIWVLNCHIDYLLDISTGIDDDLVVVDDCFALAMRIYLGDGDDDLFWTDNYTFYVWLVGGAGSNLLNDSGSKVLLFKAIGGF